MFGVYQVRVRVYVRGSPAVAVEVKVKLSGRVIRPVIRFERRREPKALARWRLAVTAYSAACFELKQGHGSAPHAASV